MPSINHPLNPDSDMSCSSWAGSVRECSADAMLCLYSVPPGSKVSVEDNPDGCDASEDVRGSKGAPEAPDAVLNLLLLPSNPGDGGSRRVDVVLSL